MQSDRYTKFILTVIAVALVAIALRDGLSQPAFASALGDEVVKVELVGVKKSIYWDAIEVKTGTAGFDVFCSNCE